MRPLLALTALLAAYPTQVRAENASSPSLSSYGEDYLAGRALPAENPTGSSAKEIEALAAARLVQAGCAAGEDAAAYSARATVVAKRLGLGDKAKSAAKTYFSCARTTGAPLTDPALEKEVLDALLAAGELSSERRKRAEDRLKKIAGLLAIDPGSAGALGDGAGPGNPAAGATAGSLSGGGKTPEQIAALVADLNEAHRNGQGRSSVRLASMDIPAPGGTGEFHALGSADVAREPTMLDRAASLAAKDEPVIAEDLRTIRESLAEAELPTVSAVNEGNPDAIRAFFEWLRTAKEADMPAIDYAIMPRGLVGGYRLGAVSKGDITLNHFIRGSPAKERATVLVHELYHYWDKKVGRNYYPNVSYGKIAEGTQHIHEYDAYLATAHYWKMVREEGASSPLARLLDRIPEDPGEVVQLVNGVAQGGK